MTEGVIPREAFIKWVERVAKRAFEIGMAQAQAGVGAFPDEDMGYRIGPEGVELFYLTNDPYDADYRYPAAIPIPWDDFDDPDLDKRLKQRHEERMRKQAQERNEWEREQYERLRAQFEKKENG